MNGDITDEYDEASVEIEELEGGNLIVEGTVRLDELEREHNLDFGDVEEESIGGFVFGRLARQVQVGDVVAFTHGEIIVEKVDGLRVDEVRIRLKHNMTQVPIHDVDHSELSETEIIEEASAANTIEQDKQAYPTVPQTLQ